MLIGMQFNAFWDYGLLEKASIANKNICTQRTLNTQIQVRNLKYENVIWNRWDMKFS
jgi:hypothetical protein